MNVDDIQVHAQPLGPVGPGGKSPGTTKPSVGPSFGEVFQKALAPTTKPTDPGTLVGPPKLNPHPELKLSAHAQQRLISRNIQLDRSDWDRINAGVDRAAAKGSKEALVMSDKAALVVSIKNRTVITAVDPASMKDNVFTNIDTAVIV
jgi:flagellar operon protein